MLRKLMSCLVVCGVIWGVGCMEDKGSKPQVGTSKAEGTAKVPTERDGKTPQAGPTTDIQVK